MRGRRCKDVSLLSCAEPTDLSFTVFFAIADLSCCKDACYYPAQTRSRFTFFHRVALVTTRCKGCHDLSLAQTKFTVAVVFFSALKCKRRFATILRRSDCTCSLAGGSQCQRLPRYLSHVRDVSPLFCADSRAFFHQVFYVVVNILL